MSTVAPPTKPLNPVLVDSEGYIDDQIRRTRRALKLVDLAAGVITLLIGLLSFVLTAAVLDHWVVPGGLNVAGRVALFGAFLAGVAWYAWRQFFPLLRPINPVFAAQTIERGAPSLKNSLLNLLLFRTHRQHMSTRVYHALEQQAALRLSSTPVDTSIDRSVLLRLGYALLLIVAVCAIYAVLSPKNIVQSAGRVLAPWADLAAPSRVQILDIKPGDLSVAKGERVAISAEIHGLREDESVRVRYSTVDEQQVDQLISMRPAEVGMRFEARLPRGSEGAADAGVEQDLHYWIEAGDARSAKHKLTVFERPTIVVQSVRYEYPSYTGFASKVDDTTADIRGLEGTKVTVSAVANQPIRKAYIDFNADGGIDPEMVVEGRRATVIFTLRLRDDRRTPEHINYMLRFTTTEGRSNVDPPVYRIEVTPDYAPEVRITEPEEPEHAARIDDIVLVGVEARDPDFQLAQVRLEGKVGERPVAVGDILTKKHDGLLRAKKPVVPADLQLKEGDVLEYWAVAEDNRFPHPNVTTSERRRLRIVGADPPQGGQGEKQPGGQQQGGNQPDDGAGQNGEQGEEGGQQGGQGGANGQEGNEGGQEAEGGQGAGGQGGNEGQQDENSNGANGGEGQGEGNQPQGDDQQQQRSGGGGSSAQQDDQQQSEGGNAGDNGGNPAAQQANPQQGERQGQATQDQPQGGAQEGGPQEGAAGQEGQPQDGQPQGGAAQEGAPGGNQQQGGAEASDSKVSPKGDEDAKAFEQIAEHLQKRDGNQQNSSNASEQGAQNPAQKGEQQPAGQGNESRTEGQPGQSAEGTPNAQQEGADAAEGANQAQANAKQPNEGASRPDNSSGAAGQSEKSSNQKPPAEGASSDDPAERATDAQQQAAPGDNPSKRQGEDTPRETENGDGNPEDPKGAQGASPDSAMNRNDGNAGSGGATGEEQGAGQSEHLSHKKAANKTDDDNKKRMDDEEPPMPSPDKRESNSRGGQGGEQSGGGQEGGGQKADAQGKGDAGQHEAADEGAGRADEQGRGETGAGAGRDQVAEGQTGESSGDQPGEGSEKREGGAEPSPSAEGNEGAHGKPSATGEAQDPQAGEPGASEQRPDDQQTPSAESQREGQPPQGNPADSPQNGNAEAGKSAAAGNQPQGGNAAAGTNGQSAPPPGGEVAPGDKANLDFARKQTDLVLERLDEQLAKKQVDDEMLKRLGWTEEELRQFVDRWKDLKSRAASEPADSPAKRELDAALRALGPIKKGSTRFQLKDRADKLRLNEGFRASAPLEYADRVQRYAKEIAETPQPAAD